MNKRQYDRKYGTRVVKWKREKPIALTFEGSGALRKAAKKKSGK